MKLKFFLNLLSEFFFSPDLLIIRIAGYLNSLVWRGLLFSFHAGVSGLGFGNEELVSEWLQIHLRNEDLWSSCMKADLTFSENSQLTIFTTKCGGDLFDDVPLLCTLCALSMFFEISSLEVSGKTLDIWFIKTDLVLDQELWSACWYLIFLNIKVFLRDLFFSSSISLSNSLIVSNFLLIF